MDERTFDLLPRNEQYAYAVGMAARLFGRERVAKMIEQVKPLVQDQMGQAQGAEKHLAGDAADPKDNYWGGVWRIYDVD